MYLTAQEQDVAPLGTAEPSRWYAVYTKHQHEKRSAELLIRKGVDVFLPSYRAVRQWKDRKKVLSLPLFPSYLFLRTNLQNKLEILRTPGVFFLVENAGRACVIPDSEIEGIQKVAQSGGQLQPHPFLRCGDMVRVRRGPLAGITGLMVRVKNEYRVVLSVELLKKAVSVEIDLTSVERLPPVPLNREFHPPARSQESKRQSQLADCHQ